MVVACRFDRGDSDLVPVEDHVDVDRFSFLGNSKCLDESKACIELDRPLYVLAEQDDLGVVDISRP